MKKLLIAVVVNLGVVSVVSGQALMSAASSGRIETVKRFLKHNPDLIKQYNKEKKPVLVRACYGAHRELVKLLLENGAGVNIAEEDGTYPIHAAARSGDVKILTMLLNAGAKPDVRRGNGWTVFHSAGFQNRIKAINFLIAEYKKSSKGWEINLDTRDEHNMTPVISALYESRKGDAALLLLESGASYTYDKEKDAYSVLHLASRVDAPRVVAWLLDRGVDVNFENKSKETALHEAISSGSLKAAKVLLDKGATVDDAAMWYVHQGDNNDMIDLIDQYPDQHKLEEEW